MAATRTTGSAGPRAALLEPGRHRGIRKGPVAVLIVAALAVLGLPTLPVLSTVTGLSPGPAGAAPMGIIKSICGYSHTAADDPIVKPGQPGASHSHDFFGSPETDAFTTVDDLKAGGTTCSFAEDRSAYWMPTLLRNGVPVDPTQVVAYYTVQGPDATSVQPYPDGLRLVAGTSTATSPQSSKVTSWQCINDASQTPATSPSATVPTCGTGESVRLVVRFPECWDGTSVDSADHKSHLAYTVASAASCPSTHPVLVPSLALFVIYPIRDGAGVALASGGQYSAHADFFNAWDPVRLSELVEGCLRAGTTCSPVSLLIDEVSAPESSSLTFNVRLSETSPSPVEVDYTTQDVTATAPGDYSPRSGRLTISAGRLSKTISVPVIDDTLSEDDEGVVLKLSNPLGATISTETRVATILDNDAGPAITAPDTIASEPMTGALGLVCELTLSEPSDRTITVQYHTVDGTATAPSDYTATSGTVTFPAGTTTKAVGVTMNADSNFSEGNETLTLVLSNPENATIADGSAVLTITDPVVVPKLYIDDTTTSESGDASFQVRLSVPTAVPVEVNYATADLTAIAPGDYTAAAGTMTIPPGAVSGTIEVPVNEDTISEADERFDVNVTSAPNAQIIDGNAKATITDNDALLSLVISDSTVREPTSATRSLRFTVSLSGPAGQPVSFNWTTADGSAVSPADYTAASGSMTLPVGVTTKTITVNVNADSINEGTETMHVRLSDVVGAAGVDLVGTGSITAP